MISEEISSIIDKCEKVAIFGHVSPDFDCLGTAYALREFLLRQKGKEVDVFADGKLTKVESQVFDPEKLNPKTFSYKNYDLIIAVDTPNLSRIGKFYTDVSKHKNVLKIDHHFTEVNDLGHFSIVERDSASCAEIVYLFLKELKATITPAMATYLYAGIATDTNSFLNDNTTPRTMRIASELFEIGADVFKVNDVSFKSMSKERWDLTKLAYDKAEFIDDFAILTLRKKDLKKVKDDVSNLSRFANTLITVEGVKIGCSISEKGLRTYACSFRSIFGVRVDKIATSLGGGGHLQAAACMLSGNEKKVKETVINAIRKGLFEQENADE